MGFEDEWWCRVDGSEVAEVWVRTWKGGDEEQKRLKGERQRGSLCGRDSTVERKSRGKGRYVVTQHATING